MSNILKVMIIIYCSYKKELMTLIIVLIKFDFVEEKPCQIMVHL